ncbi:MAG: SGNH/GDSL hydrolase family protein [Deltaproteobacteria bacterium]|nr:MAG: SGNH/GDSL hydrolase family protein [Deltaproteobacteria bacterium]
MKRISRTLVIILKWFIGGVIMLEVASFLAISLSNYWIYGQLRDGERVNYDPYALFLEGVRPTHNNPPAREKGLTVWLFGGSTMRGATDYDERTIPSFLAQYWNREEPRNPAVMVNHGEDGFNSLMETKYLQKLLIDNPAPHLIIFFDGANDSAYFAQHRTPDAHQGYDRVRGLIEDYHRSLFGLLKPLNAAMWSSFTLEIYDKIRQGVIRIDPGDPALRQFADSCEKRYDYLNKVAGGFGSKFLLVWQPCWWAETEPVAQEVRKKEDLILGKKSALRHNFVVTYQALVERLEKKPYFINYQNLLCSRTEPVYQPDGIHLLDAGRKTVAHHLSQTLKMGVLIAENQDNSKGLAALSPHQTPPR